MNDKNRLHYDENTEQLGVLLGGIAGATGEAIEASEARGQQQIVNSTSLPVNRQGHREAFEAVGFVFGEPYPNDLIFCDAEMPPGWTKRRTEHSMWSELVDEKGRRRAGVFYKAAFYDRSAHMSLDRRYVTTTDYVGPEGERHKITVRRVVDHGQGTEEITVHTSDRVESPPDRNDGSAAWVEYFAAVKARDEAVTAWLVEHYPDHENSAAYWDQA